MCMVLSFPDTFSRSGDSSSSWRSKSETEKVEELALSVAGMKWRDVGHCPPCSQCSFYLIRYQAELSASSSISTTRNSTVGIKLLFSIVATLCQL